MRRPARWPPIAKASSGTAWPSEYATVSSRVSMPDLAARRDDGHGREHLTGTGTITKSKAGAEQEASADVAAAPPREPCERPFDEQAEAREDQRGQRRGRAAPARHVPQHVERQPEQVEEPRSEEHGQGEAHDQAGHDRVGAARAALWASRRICTLEAPAGRTATHAVIRPATNPMPSRTSINASVAGRACAEVTNPPPPPPPPPPGSRGDGVEQGARSPSGRRRLLETTSRGHGSRSSA